MWELFQIIIRKGGCSLDDEDDDDDDGFCYNQECTARDCKFIENTCSCTRVTSDYF